MGQCMKMSTSWALAGCLALLLVMAAAYAYGRDVRTRVAQAETSAREQGASAFCRDLGLSSDSAAFTRCVTGLGELRGRDRSRWEADAVGIL
jgi:hypothetical protein